MSNRPTNQWRLFDYVNPKCQYLFAQVTLIHRLLTSLIGSFLSHSFRIPFTRLTGFCWHHWHFRNYHKSSRKTATPFVCHFDVWFHPYLKVSLLWLMKRDILFRNYTDKFCTKVVSGWRIKPDSSTLRDTNFLWLSATYHFLASHLVFSEAQSKNLFTDSFFIIRNNQLTLK